MSGRCETWSACFAGDDSQNFPSLVRQLEVARSGDDDRAEQVRILTTRLNKSALQLRDSLHETVNKANNWLWGRYYCPLQYFTVYIQIFLQTRFKTWAWTTNVTCIATWLLPNYPVPVGECPQYASVFTDRLLMWRDWTRLTVPPFRPRSLNSLNQNSITHGIEPMKPAKQLFLIQHQTPLAGRRA